MLPPANAALFNMSPFVFWRRYQVAVGDDGIWYLAQKEKPVFIAWRDVAMVRADDTMQRMILADRTCVRTMRLDYQLDNFLALRAYVLSHTTKESRAIPTCNSVYYRTWINKIVLLALAANVTAIAWVSFHQGQKGASLFFIALVGFLLQAVIRDPLGLQILPDAIVIKYPGWRRRIAFGAISSIEQCDLSERGNVWAAVVVNVRGDKSIRLFRFREGSLALSEALQEALKAAQQPIQSNK